MKKMSSLVLTTTLLLTPIASLVQPIPTVQAAYTETAVNTKGSVSGISQLNVRKTPSATATSLGKVARGGTMTVRTTFTSNGTRWYKIQWGSGYAYVPQKYVTLSTADVVFKKTAYAVNGLDVKSRPLTTASNVTSLQKGDSLTTLSYRYSGTTRWYKVQSGSSIGYVQASQLTFSAPVANVLTETNIERKAAGLSALAASSEANRVAQVRADEMARTGQFSHQLRENGSPGDTLDKYNVEYYGWGENIYMGSSSPAIAVDAWMNSSGHRANILNKSYTHLGIGTAKNAKGSTIHVQVFLIQ